MGPTLVRPPRRRGRPPKPAPGEPSARDRLLDAAFDACLQAGFEGVVLSDVAVRAGVTANAIYRHFDTKLDLLVATARRVLDRLGTPPERREAPSERARRIALAFLRPEAAGVRRFVLEVNLAARRTPELAGPLEEWNAETVARWVALTGDGPEDRARIKALYLLLLGACQLESLDDVEAPRVLVAELLADTTASLMAPYDAAPTARAKGDAGG